MSFKFFRKHEKLMLWIIVVITIFTFSIFSVTSTMRACFRPKDLPLASFVSASGKKVEITEHLYRHAWLLLRKMAPLLGIKEVTEAEIYPHIILDYEAKEGGLKVTDGELKNFLSQFRFKSTVEYDNLVRRLGYITRKKFEEDLREVLRVAKLKQIIRSGEDLIRIQDLYDQFKIDNEEFKLAYVAFPSKGFEKEITRDQVDEKALASWYDGLPAAAQEVKELFSEPEKFSFDVAYLDLEKTKYGDFEGLLGKEELKEIPEHEYQHRYDLTKERFAVKSESGKEKAGDEAAEGEAEAGGKEKPGEKKEDKEKEGKEKEEEVTYRNWKEDPEVKKTLEQEIRICRLLDRMSREWTAFARERKIIGEGAATGAAEKGEAEAGTNDKVDEGSSGEAEKGKASEGAEKKEGASGGGGPCLPGEGEAFVPQEGGGEDGKAASDRKPGNEAGAGGETAKGDEGETKKGDEDTEKTSEAFFQELVEKYRLTRDRVEDPVPLPELETLPRYGSVTLKEGMMALKVNNSRYIPPCKEHPYLPLVVRVTRLVPRRKRALSEVHDLAMDKYLEKLRRDRAQKEAETFFNTMKEKARALPEVKKQIETWEADALQGAEKEIASKADITEQEAAAIRNRAKNGLKGQIDDLLKRYLYLVFEEEAQARGLAVAQVDYFRKSEVMDPAFRAAEDTPEKFVKSSRVVLGLDTHGVSMPLYDAKTDAWYVVEVKDRRFPPPEAMTQADLKKYRMQAERMRMLRLRYPQYFKEERPDPFTYERVVEKYKLRLFKKKKNAQAEGGGKTPPAAGAPKGSQKGSPPREGKPAQ